MTKDEHPSKQEILKAISDAVYAQYPKKEWQGLSDGDVTDLVNFWNISDIEIEPFIEMVVRKVKEKNT
jgi:trehalose/maltose hydrolase-like predicted phosphorylase